MSCVAQSLPSLSFHVPASTHKLLSSRPLTAHLQCVRCVLIESYSSPTGWTCPTQIEQNFRNQSDSRWNSVVCGLRADDVRSRKSHGSNQLEMNNLRQSYPNIYSLSLFHRMFQLKNDLNVWPQFNLIRLKSGDSFLGKIRPLSTLNGLSICRVDRFNFRRVCLSASRSCRHNETLGHFRPRPELRKLPAARPFHSTEGIPVQSGGSDVHCRSAEFSRFFFLAHSFLCLPLELIKLEIVLLMDPFIGFTMTVAHQSEFWVLIFNLKIN